MIFLNALLLFGAAAFSIPLIIHLLNRSKFQTIDWGAMIFLEDAAKVNSRRLRWQTWLLLLLRCLIPIVLAICMARPILRSYFFPNGFIPSSGDQTATVLIIDNSISMQASANDTEQKEVNTLAKQSHDLAEQLVARTGNNTRWSISTWDDTNQNARFGFSRDQSILKERTSKIDSNSGLFPLLDQISSALDTLAKSPDPSQRVIVVSDFQANDIRSIDSAGLATLRDRIERLPIKPVIALMPIGNRVAGAQPATDSKQNVAPANLSIAIDRNTQSLVGVKQAWELRARIKNHSPTAVVDVPILIQVDGRSLTTRRVDLPGDAESQLAVTLEFPSHGSHVVTASIEHEEAVSSDNRASWAVLAVGAIPTLLVSDDFSDDQQGPRKIRGDEKSWSDADYLTAALGYSPRRRNTSNKKDGLFSVTRVASSQCSLAELKRHKLLLLANVSELSRECSQHLGTWVAEGGTLIAFPGEETKINWYNSLREPTTESLAVSSKATGDSALSGQQLFPYAYEKKLDEREDNQAGVSIRREIYSHPSVRFLNDPRWSSVDSLNVRKWLVMTPHKLSTSAKPRTSGTRFIAVDSDSKPAASRDANATEETDEPSRKDLDSYQVLSLTSGDPFLAIKQVGLGSVIQCATSAGDQWSNWPMRPVYLPMIQQLLIGAVPPGRWVCNVEIGETLTLPTENMLRWIESDWQIDNDLLPAKEIKSDESSTRLMRWTLPTANLQQTSVQQPTDQITNSDRTEGETGQPAIVARQSGVYTASPQADSMIRQGKSIAQNLQTSPPISMCAQLPPGESDLRLETSEGLDLFASQMNAHVIRSVDEYVSLESGQSSELWRWFLIALLVLLFAEVLLQRYLSLGGIR